MSQHLEPRPRKLQYHLQMLSLALVLTIGATISYLMFTQVEQERTQARALAQLEVELVRANTCVIAGLLVTAPEERDAEAATQIVDDCLSQIVLPRNLVVLPEGEE